MLFCLSSCGGETKISTEIGEGIFSSFVTTDMNGIVVTQKVFEEHKVTMINLWGTFCSPCISEMPDLAELNKEYADQGFQVIGIPIDIVDQNMIKIDDKVKDARDIISSTGADFMHIVPSETLHEAYLKNVQSTPETIFVNKEGKIIGSSYYGAKSKAEWENIIKTLLESVE